MGQERKYASPIERQRAYRVRVRERVRGLEAEKAELEERVGVLLADNAGLRARLAAAVEGGRR
jgi:hypothetical protein